MDVTQQSIQLTYLFYFPICYYDSSDIEIDMFIKKQLKKFEYATGCIKTLRGPQCGQRAAGWTSLL